MKAETIYFRYVIFNRIFVCYTYCAIRFKPNYPKSGVFAFFDLRKQKNTGGWLPKTGGLIVEFLLIFPTSIVYTTQILS